MHKDLSEHGIVENLSLVAADLRETFRDITFKIEGLVRIYVLKTLTCSRTGITNLLVYSIFEKAGKFQVIRIGELTALKAVADERHGLEDAGLLERWCLLTNFGEPAYKHGHLGAIILDFPTELLDEPHTFKDTYEENPFPSEMITSLVEKLLLGKSDETVDIPLKESLKVTEEVKYKILAEAERITATTGVMAMPHLTIQDKFLLNPLHFYPFNETNEPEDTVLSTPIAEIHGGLTPQNILYYRGTGEEGPDEEARPTVIEVPFEEIRSIYTDIVDIECGLKFEVLNTERVDPEDLLRFVFDNLLVDINITNRPPVKDPHLQKLMGAVSVLRRVATDSIVRGVNPDAFWVALYRATITEISRSGPSDVQKRHALLAASIILTRYLSHYFKIDDILEFDDSASFKILEEHKEDDKERLSTGIMDNFRTQVHKSWLAHKADDFPAGTDYIEPRLRHIVSAGPRPGSTLQPAGQAGNETEFSHFKIKDLIVDRRKFLLVADSGHGKTTLLRELQHRIFSADHLDLPVPVYFHMRDLSGVFSIDELLDRVCDSFHGEHRRVETLRTLHKIFNEGRFIFLLDGIDQVEDRSNIPRLLGRDGILEEHRVIMAGRPYALSGLGNLLKDFERLELETFTVQNARRYLGEERYEKLREFVKAAPLRAPMVLSILRGIDISALENFGRSTIYDLMVDCLLDKEAALQTLSHPDIQNLQDFKKLFAKLSYLLIEAGCSGRFSWETAEEALPELGLTVGSLTRLSHLGIMSEVIEGSPHPGRELVFRHQSFQEYFAAIELGQRLFDSSGNLKKDELLKILEHNKWDESLLFLSGSLGEDKAFELITAISEYDLFFAGRCACAFSGNTDTVLSCLIEALFKRSDETAALKTLTEIGSRGIFEKLFAMLDSGDKTVKKSILMAFGEVGSAEAVPALIKRLTDEDEELCILAARALGTVGSSEATPPLMKLLKSEDSYMKAAAARALGEIGSIEAVLPLIELLDNTDEYVLRWASWSLGEIGAEAAVGPLIEVLRKGDEDVSWAAARSLGHIGAEGAVEPLIELLQNKKDSVRWSAARALGEIGSETAVGPLLDKLDDPFVRRSAARALGAIGSELAIEPLIKMLRTGERTPGGPKVLMLGATSIKEELGPMIRLLETEKTRWAAAEALGDIGSERAVMPLIKLLDNDDETIRRAAANALGDIGRVEAVGPLIDLLEDESEFVRWASVEALGRIGSEHAVEALIKVHEDGNVSWSAAKALGEIGSVLAVGPLIKLLDDISVRKSAASALGELENELAVGPLLRLFNDKDEDVSMVAAEALGKIGSKIAVDPLIKSLGKGDDYMATLAAGALGAISTKLDENELLSLAKKLHEGGHTDALEKIKEATQRRLLYLAETKK